MIQARDIVALAGGRTIHELVHHLPATRTKALTVVQAMGSVDSTVNAFDAQEVGRVMAQRPRRQFPFPSTPPPSSPTNAPGTPCSSSSRSAACISSSTNANVALVGLGTLANSVFVERGTLDAAMIRDLKRAGAAGEVCGRFIDADGEECATTWRDRVISVDVEQLRKIPQVIGVVSGNDRSAAILAAVAGRIIKSLVIDELGASALLASVPSQPRSRKKAKK
jgi:DNA-binding transcriptional regulator LsrR (DeoR family)